MECNICPRLCGKSRNLGEFGVCNVSDTVKIARAALHFWEEPCISGEFGSGTVFFSGCPLRCVYCQNREISGGEVGFEVSIQRLSEIFIEQQQRGAHNVNLVTPTQFIPQILKALEMAKRNGFSLPLVYNTGGYERIESLKMLEGNIDVYLPDFKYFSPDLAKKYSKAEDYPEAAKAAFAEMVRQNPECVFDDDGIIKKGVIVRHMILPGRTEDSMKIIEYLYKTYGDSIYLSIMNQYTPINMEKYPEINRSVSKKEYDRVINYAIKIGVENAFIQEGGTVSESFIPAFNGEGVLECNSLLDKG